MKNSIIVVTIMLLAGLGVYYFLQNMSQPDDVGQKPAGTSGSVVPETPAPKDAVPEPPKETPKQSANENSASTVIGKSGEGRDITAYHFGGGSTELLFVGGIHGGYSWNTALVAYELMDYLRANPNVIPGNVRVTVIPVLNPDGLSKVVGIAGRFSKSDVSSSQDVRVSGRFNAKNVDLNRNFDCDWQSSAVWQDRAVNAGSEAFSESESAAIRNYVNARSLAAVVVWYSAVGGVFASNCHDGILPETLALTNTYAKASGYPAYEEFNFYEITGDMVNWLAKKKIPAISVLLTTHDDIEWNKNRAGIEAFLRFYSK